MIAIIFQYAVRVLIVSCYSTVFAVFSSGRLRGLGISRNFLYDCKLVKRISGCLNVISVLNMFRNSFSKVNINMRTNLNKQGRRFRFGDAHPLEREVRVFKPRYLGTDLPQDVLSV